MQRLSTRQGQRQVPNLNLATPFLIVGQVQVRLGLRYYFSCLRLGEVQVYALNLLKKPGGPGFQVHETWIILRISEAKSYFCSYVAIKNISVCVMYQHKRV